MLRKIDLSGEWGFRADEEMLGIEKKYYNTAAADTIALPSTTAISRKGRLDDSEKDGYLTCSYPYEGYAWYYKDIAIGELGDDERAELYLERTRLTKLWINGEFSGESDSLCTPHVYDVTEHVRGEILHICVLVSNVGYTTAGGHMTSKDTQTNWNGITGEISLIISKKAGIREIQAFPDIHSHSVTLRLTTVGLSRCEIRVWGASSDGKTIDEKLYRFDPENPEISVFLGDDASLWTEHSPVTYTLMAALPESADITPVTFGLREFRADGTDFKLNGRAVHLRGKHDGLIFPLTGAAPTTVSEWAEVLQTAKNWGINHYRFHTCCPPEAAFTAADILGIFMQPELPFWGTVHAADDPDADLAEQAYLIEEGRRILRKFGNHPSFVMMSLGNELWGSPERLNEILGELRALDSRHLYTQGSNNFQFFPNIQPNDDFFSGVRLSRERLLRGSYATCDAPLGFVQTDRPNTVHSYDALIFPEISGSAGDSAKEIEIQYGTGVKRVKVDASANVLIPDKPVVTHEVGQYCSYPDYTQLSGYKGVMKPYNILEFRERLTVSGMGGYAEELHLASGMLAFYCYKIEIEAAMRSRLIASFQLLDIQDFSGQGMAFVGMLDPLMREKPFVTRFGLREKWLGFCSDIVILAEIPDFVGTIGQCVSIPVKLRNMSAAALSRAEIKWTFGTQSGVLTVPDGTLGLAEIGEISLKIGSVGCTELTLELVHDGTEAPVRNSYELWGLPTPVEKFIIPEISRRNGSEVHIIRSTQEASELLSQGAKVLLIPEKQANSVPGMYCTDFWCYPMFRSISESMGKEVPVGTLGLLIDEKHPIFRGFPTKFYSTPQWYEIVTHADNAVLDGTDADFRPIVQTIDNFERNHKLGLVFEAKVGAGRLLWCGCRVWEAPERPEIQAFFNALLDYAHSDIFEPAHELQINILT